MSADQLAPGEIIGGDFQIERFLKAGGMGDIYVARQLSTDKPRALKIMQAHLTRDPRNQERFKQEAKFAARINSPNVVEVVGAGIDEHRNRLWLAMELLDGSDLRSYVERVGPLSSQDLVLLFEQLCRALQRAHDAGIVHRDLKPENIFLTLAQEPGQPFFVKVLDFGIAKIIADYKSQNIGTMQLGTPLWMAPEQMDSSQPVTPAADLWPLGLIAFWALTQRSYWRSANQSQVLLPAVMTEVITGELAPASARAAEHRCAERLPAGFDGWFARCVDRNPLRRFASVSEATAALVALFPSVHISHSLLNTPRPRPSVPPTRATRRASLAAAAAVGVAGLAVLLWIYWRWGPTHDLRTCEGVRARGGASVAQAQACLRACKGGQTSLCLTSGEALLSALGAEPTLRKEAVTSFRRACEEKSTEGCSRLAQLLNDGVPGVVYRDRSAALDLFITACNAEPGRGQDCVTAGRMLQSGESTRRDPRQARELFRRACDLNLLSACGLLGDSLFSDEGGKPDELHAGSLFNRACESGDAHSCQQLARLLEEGRVLPKNTARALEVYGKACGLGVTPACVKQADLLLGGQGVEHDVTRAAAVYSAACDKAEASACCALGLLYVTGSSKGIAVDDARGRALLARGKAAGAKEGCEAPLRIVPLVVPPKPRCNQDCLLKKCEDGSGDACLELGSNYERGRFATKNLCMAHKNYKSGCVFNNHPESCANHARFHRQYPNLCPETQ